MDKQHVLVRPHEHERQYLWSNWHSNWRGVRNRAGRWTNAIASAVGRHSSWELQWCLAVAIVTMCGLKLVFGRTWRQRRRGAVRWYCREQFWRRMADYAVHGALVGALMVPHVACIRRIYASIGSVGLARPVVIVAVDAIVALQGARAVLCPTVSYPPKGGDGGC